MSDSLGALKWDEKQPVSYCVPLWLRDIQVQRATARPLPRLAPSSVVHPDKIAIVCYGPSLNDTWEEVRDYKYIISCSGSHRFLLDRGIVPTWHVEVDPRKHKVALLGAPHPDVRYLIASSCHGDVFTHLEGLNVTLWHVFTAASEAHRILPRGEWAVTGGSSVGLRALTLARVLGFQDLHVFGMDGCEGASGKHAAAHPMQPKGHRECEYEGVVYRTTPSMLECARETWHELDQMPDVRATFYGDGLVQVMAKRYVRTKMSYEPALAKCDPEVISAEYRALNRQMHESHLAYGVGGARHAATVTKMAEAMKAQSILDYGCGKGLLAQTLPIPIWEYDPAIPGKEASPRPADLVVCTDVLEHVEPDKLGPVLADLRRCVRQVGFFTIHTGPAGKTLPDGRNTHLIQHGLEWWEKRLKAHFTVGKILKNGAELYVVVAPKKKSAQAVA